MPALLVRIWDPLVRLVHWSVAALVVIDLLNEAGANPWHRYFGYAAGALVVARLTWGLLDTNHARHSVMAASAGRALPYVRLLLARRGGKHLGHNPLGALMAYTLWGLVIAVAVTGWMLTLDRFFGDDLMQDIHGTLSYVLAGFACAHIAGVLVTSALQRENLSKAMITGQKTSIATKESGP